MWLQSPVLSCTHGFSTRHGGVSSGVFSSLNLGGNADDPLNIESNRTRALHNLGLQKENLCLLQQEHGNKVHMAAKGIQRGDALVTSEAGPILAVSAADCYPVLFSDPKASVIAAAHAGWRGIVSGITGNTVKKMIAAGAREEQVLVAIGPGISVAEFEVGPEVIGKFLLAGFPANCIYGNKIDLLKCIIFTLVNNGITEKNIWAMNRSSTEPDFFSHRRDHKITGRMWGLISMKA